LANALVGNGPGAVALEVTLAGPTLEATGTHAVALVGAPFDVWLNDRRQPAARTFVVNPGDVLTVATTRAGLRTYLAVRGGFESDEVLASRSALEPLRAGQVLACPAGRLRTRFARLPADEGPRTLRVLPGTHAGLFPEGAFAGQEYVVRPESNRMGLRLAAEPLRRPPGGELLSAPVCPGTVQVTNDGQAVVLGVDAQTIGGYPRVAQVITADLDRLAQLAPGDRVRFEPTDLASAAALARERRRWLAEWTTRLRESLI
jgi:antagonist of KipI